MTNENELQLLKFDFNEDEFIDLDELEKELEQDVANELDNLEVLEEDRKKIGDPESLSNVIKETIWQQFQAQIGTNEANQFVEKNRGLSLDLRNSAHIQTAENFVKGNIATHNYISKQEIEQNYDRYKNTSHKKFRNDYVNPGMDKTLERAGTLNDRGVNTVTDIYTGRQIPTATKLENGKNNPRAAQREHVNPSAELYNDPSLQMANNNEELAAIINDPENLQGYTTAERNNRKSDSSSDNMQDVDKTKHWEKSKERADKHKKQKQKEGESRLKEEGRKTQKEEALKAGTAALKTILFSLLSNLLREIFFKLVQWFKSAKKNISTLLDAIKNAITSFVKDFKKNFEQAASIGVMSIVSMIFSPFARLIKSAFCILKQGVKSVKEAIFYFKKPENKNKSLGIKLLEVSKIIIAGISATGAIAMGEFFEKILMQIPGFAFEIPILGSIANIVGFFLGAAISGIIGSIVLNFIDKIIAKKEKQEIDSKKLDKVNEILQKQNKLTFIKDLQLKKTKSISAENISKRHAEANDATVQILCQIDQNRNEINEIIDKIEYDDDFNSLMDSFKKL